MSDDERAIRDLVERWMTANRAGDAATVLGLMDDDVVVFMVLAGHGIQAGSATRRRLRGLDLPTVSVALDAGDGVGEIARVADENSTEPALTIHHEVAVPLHHVVGAVAATEDTFRCHRSL